MGIFSWLFGEGEKELYKREPVKLKTKRIKIEDDKVFEICIVGESHYQEELEEICGGYTEKGHNLQIEAKLIYEDDNEHDDNAISIEIDGNTVGYLSREDAKLYREKMEAIGYSGNTVGCQAIIKGGWDYGNGDRGFFGVKLYLPKTFFWGRGKWVSIPSDKEDQS